MPSFFNFLPFLTFLKFQNVSKRCFIAAFYSEMFKEIAPQKLKTSNNIAKFTAKLFAIKPVALTIAIY